MKFCGYCGRQLQDGEECHCRDIESVVKEAEAVFSDTSDAADDTEDAAEEGVSNEAQNTSDAAGNVAASANDTVESAGEPADPVMAESTGTTGITNPEMPGDAQKRPAGDKMKILKTAGIICGGAAIVVLLIFAFSAVFASANAKIRKAAAKTAADGGYLYEEIKNFKYGGKNYTFSLGAELQNIELEVNIATKGNDKEVSFSIGDGKDDFGAVAQVGKKEVRLKGTGVDYNKILVYDYTSEDKDALESMVGEQTLKTLDDYFTALYNATSDTSNTRKYQNIIGKWWKNVETEKTDKKSIKVDGEKRDCSGYLIKFEKDSILEMITELLEEIEKDNPETFESPEIKSVDDMIDEIEAELDKIDFDDIETEVFLYKGMIAAIVIDNDGEKLTAEFNGGDYRLQNFQVYFGKKSDGNVLAEGSGKTKDDKESYKITVPEKYELEFTFDKSSNKFEATASQYSYWSGGFSELLKVKGTLKCSRSEINLTTKSVAFGGVIQLDKVEMILSAKASLQNLKGKEFNVNEAEKDELNDEITAIGEAYAEALKGSELYDLISTFLR